MRAYPPRQATISVRPTEIVDGPSLVGYSVRARCMVRRACEALAVFQVELPTVVSWNR